MKEDVQHQFLMQNIIFKLQELQMKIPVKQMKLFDKQMKLTGRIILLLQFQMQKKLRKKQMMRQTIYKIN